MLAKRMVSFAGPRFAVEGSGTSVQPAAAGSKTALPQSPLNAFVDPEFREGMDQVGAV